MRHNTAGRKLGRTTASRLALFRNQIASLVSSERIVTTLPKAKELRPIAERLITQGKRGTVHARRLVGRWLSRRELLKKIFDEIAPRFSERPGGYLRIVKLGPRAGDGAEQAVLEFVDFADRRAAAKAAVKSSEEAKGKSKKGKKGEAKPSEPAAAPAKAAATEKAPSKAAKAEPKAAAKAPARKAKAEPPAKPAKPAKAAPKKGGRTKSGE